LQLKKKKSRSKEKKEGRKKERMEGREQRTRKIMIEIFKCNIIDSYDFFILQNNYNKSGIYTINENICTIPRNMKN